MTDDQRTKLATQKALESIGNEPALGEAWQPTIKTKSVQQKRRINWNYIAATVMALLAVAYAIKTLGGL